MLAVPRNAQERRSIRGALLREVVRVHRQLQAAARSMGGPQQMRALQDWDTAYAQVGRWRRRRSHAAVGVPALQPARDRCPGSKTAAPPGAALQVMLAQQRSITQLIELVNQQHQQAQAIIAEINRKQQVDALAEPGHDLAVRWAHGACAPRTGLDSCCTRTSTLVGCSIIRLPLTSSCHPSVCLQ
jgi:hypothetical protein